VKIEEMMIYFRNKKKMLYIPPKLLMITVLICFKKNKK